MDASRCSECGNPSPSSHEAGPIVDVTVTPGTRHYTLLNTNEPPEDSELIFIRSVVAKISARLTRLDDEISTLQGKLKQLEGERPALLSYGMQNTAISSPLRHLDDEISTLREMLKQLEDERGVLLGYQTRNAAILSPLRRMPSEVLAEIFSRTLPSIDDNSGIDSDMSHSPWLLTHISSRWRAVCLSTASLWSRIVIIYSSSNPSKNYSLALVETQIHRAQYLHINFYGSAKIDSGPQIEMFELLLKHSSRWEELSLGMTPEMLPLMAALRDRIPLLKRFYMHPYTNVQSLDCLQTAPSLVDFGVNNSHHFVSIAFPAQHLTRYRLNGPLQRHLNILEQARNLVQAHIIIDLDDELRVEKTEVILLPHIRWLFLSHSEALDYLEAPALEGFAAWVRPEDADIDIGHLESFLSRSECPLRRLCLRNSNAHIIAQFLRRFPSITELAISDEDHNREDFEFLMSTLASLEVAPQLHSLFFGSEEGSGITDYSMYHKMLRTRWEADGSGLKNAALLVEESRPDPGTLQNLHALRLEGLDLLILEGPVALKEMYSWFYSSTWML
ncbi:hypothetical protein C8R45DRAFT_1215471 [Mycena sanguinolenta]|nr:hypothetical protein C8R45DRAFT_1215471 [Mycena sanguinolenta]